ncbi:MAG TPA: FAD-dependent oxidoreductase [Bryobacteraceae bacterium]|jgi:glycine/D-amino acid oxidase-like deaminating enzyme|nr:FAD-dependent oxidoreductase [Bryobacteraceae bacterium]
MQRRRFLSAALVGLTAKAGPRQVAGGFVNDAFPLGHRIRDRAKLPAAQRTERFPVVIVGGGIAGLSAAWRLRKKGFTDFVLLEMEAQPGGNSRWGENEITAYPWAAHYVPVPDPNETLVRELFEELGVLQDGKWDERQLCFSPQERLYLLGRWQEGIEPEVGASGRDHEQYRRFENTIQELRASGQFTIPMERGAPRDSPLDRLTMQQWMAQQKLDSRYLNWYVNYACRDDYGSLARDTSAWAGVHYFTARNQDEKGPLTWPEGNGWIARRLIARLKPWIRPSSPVFSITRDGRRLRVRSETVEYSTERVIFAAPAFLASYIVEGAPRAEGFVYSPWLTANLTLDRIPEEQGLDPAWDNVIFDSPSLGYVVATHMSLRSRIDRTVWTYYWALADGAPAATRQMLLDKDWSYWREAILNDLSRAHKDIRECVSRIDVMRMGHAMARPVPGFLGSETRRRFFESKGPVYYANSDLSGFSIFEEAQYRGVTAADRVLRDLGKRN